MAVNFTLLWAGHCTNHENLSMQGGRRMAIKFPAMVGLIEHPQAGPILFDTGYAEHFFEETRHFPGSIYGRITPVFYEPAQGIAAQLTRRGIRPEDVELVILSHFHADHVAGVKDFPLARFLCYEHAYRQLQPMGSLRALTHGFLPGLLPADFEARTTALEQGRVVELPPRFRPFTTGVDLLGDRSIIAVDLPGHALGHFGILLDTEPKPYFLVGDACWHTRSFRENLMPHWLPQRLVFSDRHAYRNTLLQLHQLSEHAPDLIIVPSHCGEVFDDLIASAATPQ